MHCDRVGSGTRQRICNKIVKGGFNKLKGVVHRLNSLSLSYLIYAVVFSNTLMLINLYMNI